LYLDLNMVLLHHIIWYCELMSKNTILLSALNKLAQPLVQVLLRHGVACEDFVELIRRSFVSVAEHEFAPQGRKQSLMNIALITGIHRHEVKKLMESAKQVSMTKPQHHRAARVINGWINDRDFSINGAARTLDIATEFKQLVSQYSGDITPRPILDELLRVGAVEKPTADTLKLLVPAYIPHNSDEDLIQIFGDSVTDLLSTLDYNLKSETAIRRLQISVVHTNLPDEVLSNIELQFFETQDRDSNPNVKGNGRNRAGIGLYFFQEKMEKN